jgi:hypothetical protein
MSSPKTRRQVTNAQYQIAVMSYGEEWARLHLKVIE